MLKKNPASKNPMPDSQTYYLCASNKKT